MATRPRGSTPPRLTGAVAVLPFLALVGATSPARAEPARSAVEARLRGYEHVFGAADFAALGPGTDRVLSQIGEDGKVDALVRARAVSALAFAPTPAARAYLEGLLHRKAASAEAIDRLLLRKAAVALGWQGGPGAVAKIAPLLAHADEDVRIDAAIGLGLTRMPDAAGALRGRLDAETTPAVKRRVERELRTLEAALASEDAVPSGQTGKKP